MHWKGFGNMREECAMGTKEYLGNGSISCKSPCSFLDSQSRRATGNADNSPPGYSNVIMQQ